MAICTAEKLVIKFGEKPWQNREILLFKTKPGKCLLDTKKLELQSLISTL